MENPAEIPQEETKLETIEPTELSRDVDSATFESDFFIEGQMEIEVAEATQAAFVEVIQLTGAELNPEIPVTPTVQPSINPLGDSESGQEVEAPPGQTGITSLNSPGIGEDSAPEKVEGDAPKEIQPLDDLSIVAGVETSSESPDLSPEGAAFVDSLSSEQQDALTGIVDSVIESPDDEDLRSKVAEANESQSYGTMRETGEDNHSRAREIPVSVSGPGGEPNAVIGDLSAMGESSKESGSETSDDQDQSVTENLSNITDEEGPSTVPLVDGVPSGMGTIVEVSPTDVMTGGEAPDSQAMVTETNEVDTANTGIDLSQDVQAEGDLEDAYFLSALASSVANNPEALTPVDVGDSTGSGIEVTFGDGSLTIGRTGVLVDVIGTDTASDMVGIPVQPDQADEVREKPETPKTPEEEVVDAMKEAEDATRDANIAAAVAAEAAAEAEAAQAEAVTTQEAAEEAVRNAEMWQGIVERVVRGIWGQGAAASYIGSTQEADIDQSDWDHLASVRASAAEAAEEADAAAAAAVAAEEAADAATAEATAKEEEANATMAAAAEARKAAREAIAELTGEEPPDPRGSPLISDPHEDDEE